MNLLPQLQHLNEILTGLWSRLTELEAENKDLTTKQSEQSQLSSQEVQVLKDNLIMTQTRCTGQEEALASLQKRYDSLQQAHETMRQEFDRLTQDFTVLREQQKVLLVERDELYKKNEHAKIKVEAIIQRLASLTLLDSHEDNMGETANEINDATAQIHESFETTESAPEKVYTVSSN